MPRRTDIHTILLIGSGPIVIGQACEFDYSGTQACKALREEGYRVVLVNSNPATIMTDPEFADRTYIEPMTVEIVEQIIAARAARRAAADARRPDGAEPRDRARRARACSRRYGVELIGANARRRSRRPRTASSSRRRCSRSASTLPRVGLRAHARRGAARSSTRSGCPLIIRPSLHARRHRRRHRLQRRRSSTRIVRVRRSTLSPDARGPGRGVVARLEGVRARGDARPRRTTSSSSARSRTSTRWACTPATRSPSRRRRR